jgi:predicted transcriptional regulator
MSQSLTITLSPEIESSVRQLSDAEGVSPEEIVRRAVEQHLFLRRFRTLR